MSFFDKSSNKPLEDYIEGRKLNLIRGSSYFVVFTAYSLWITLYIYNFTIIKSFQIFVSLPKSESVKNWIKNDDLHVPYF